MPVARDVLDLEHDAVRGGGVAVEDLAQVATDHVAHDLVLGQAAACSTITSLPSRRMATRSASCMISWRRWLT